MNELQLNLTESLTVLADSNNIVPINKGNISIITPINEKELRRFTRRQNGIPANYKEDESQEVFPFKDIETINKMKEYYLNKKQYRNYALFVVGINVGLRASDLLPLCWETVLQKDGSIVDGITLFEQKTGKKRLFFLNTSAKEALLLYKSYLLKNSKEKACLVGYIFRSRKGGCLLPSSVIDILTDAAQYAGVTFNVGTHSLRKTFGYHQFMAHKGDPMFLAELQNMFNHDSPKITLRYIGIEAETFKTYYNDINL